MSSGSGYDGPPVPPPRTVDCASLVEKTILNSPVEAVVEKLNAHDVLRVTLSQEGGVQIVIAVTESGETAGSLTPICLVALIRCLSEGRDFIAVVMNKTGAMVRVELRPASK